MRLHNLFKRKLTFPVLCLALGLVVFGVSYALLGLSQSQGSDALAQPVPLAQLVADEDKPDGDKLVRALMFEDNQRLQDLLEGGADPNSPTTDGYLPLQIAVFMAKGPETPYEETAYGKIQLLIRYGANPNQPGSNGSTPMHIAASRGTEAVMTALVNAGGDANLSINGGRTPYERAVASGNAGGLAALKKVLPDYVPADKEQWKLLQQSGIIIKGLREARRLTGKARIARHKKTLDTLVLRGDLTVQEAEDLYQKISKNIERRQKR